MSFFLFFFNDTATTEIYTLSLHDALPISERRAEVVTEMERVLADRGDTGALRVLLHSLALDRKSTRLNSSHSQISYAVFCLKKKKNKCAGGSERSNTSDHYRHTRMVDQMT